MTEVPVGETVIWQENVQTMKGNGQECKLTHLIIHMALQLMPPHCATYSFLQSSLLFLFLLAIGTREVCCCKDRAARKLKSLESGACWLVEPCQYHKMIKCVSVLVFAVESFHVKDQAPKATFANSVKTIV